MKSKITLVLCVMLALIMLAQVDHSDGSAQCKDLNQVNCYVSQNAGNFCSRKDQTKTETRWYYDKGVCRKFSYNGCNGNRNRFCTKEACERRCAGE